jgi:hypothetical protein
MNYNKNIQILKIFGIDILLILNDNIRYSEFLWIYICLFF